MALLITVMLLLALSSLAAGMLWIAAAQNAAASITARHARFRLDMEAAALDAFARWQTPRPRHPVGETWAVDAGTTAESATVLADRLTPTLTLLRVTHIRRTPEGLAAVMRVGLLVRTVQPEELLESFPAALTAGAANLGDGALIDATDPALAPDGWYTVDCPDAGAAALDSLYGGQLPGAAVPDSASVRRDGSSRIRGWPPVLARPGLVPPEQARLGPIPWAAIPDIADLTVRGTVHPAAREVEGRCAVGRPDNWGAPGGVGPCSRYAPVIYAPSGLVVSGGAGQGILVVRGDVKFENGARFYGPVFASGELLVNDSARIVGAARAGTATIRNATIQYRVCPLWRAWSDAPALRRAFRPQGRWWLPDYVRAP